MRYIYYVFRAMAKYCFLQLKKLEALTYHWEDGKQYHVIEDDPKWYKIVNRESIKHHNKIAKGSNQFKHFTMKEINDMAIYSTPLKGKAQL